MPGKIAGLRQKGAVSVDTSMATVELSDAILTMLNNPSHVREVVLGTRGVFLACSRNKGCLVFAKSHVTGIFGFPTRLSYEKRCPRLLLGMLPGMKNEGCPRLLLGMLWE